MAEKVMIRWYDHSCDWITKYCDEHHVRSFAVSEEDLLRLVSPEREYNVAKDGEVEDEGTSWFGDSDPEFDPPLEADEVVVWRVPASEWRPVQTSPDVVIGDTDD